MHTKEEYPNSSDVSLLSRQHFTMHITDKPEIQNEFSKYVLVAVIGITFLLVILLTIVHLWQKLKDMKREKIKRERRVFAGNENGNVQLPLDPVYQDINEF